MNRHFSQEYLSIKVSHLKDELDKLPNLRLNMHRGKLVVCSREKKNGKNTKSVHLLKGKELEKALAVVERRKSLKNKINQYSVYLDKETIVRKIEIDLEPPHVLPISLKETMIPDSNTMYPKKNDYWHRKTQMRSRLELQTAAALDSLGLEFYYEPALEINGKTYYPDFVVFLPELGCCFIIECLGMVNSTEYVYNNMNKMANYILAGIIPSKNILTFCGTDTMMPSIDEMKTDIVNLVNKMTASRVSVA